jgi:CAAX prenyl protease-like protein
LFNNSIVGAPKSSLPGGAKASAAFILFRLLSSVVNVPILEELFWRGWLMRWLISKDFQKIPLGATVGAVLLAGGCAFRLRARLLLGCGINHRRSVQLVDDADESLADCRLAHAVTNACLAAYVLTQGQWQYWL